MGARSARQNVSAIFDQKQTVPIAQRPEPGDVARKSEVVDRQNSSDVAVDLRFEIGPIRLAVTPHGVENNFGPEVLERLDGRRTYISGDQNFLAGLKSYGAQ